MGIAPYDFSLSVMLLFVMLAALVIRAGAGIAGTIVRMDMAGIVRAGPGVTGAGIGMLVMLSVCVLANVHIAAHGTDIDAAASVAADIAAAFRDAIKIRLEFSADGIQIG